MSATMAGVWRRLAVAGSIAVLVGFHADLLLGRLLDGTVLQPAVAAEWLLSLGILWLFWRFRRRGVPVLRGRRALALWFLVLLLHAVAVGPETDGARHLVVDQSLLIGVPLGVALGLLVLRSANRGSRRRASAWRLDRALWLVQHPAFVPRTCFANLIPAPRAPPA